MGSQRLASAPRCSATAGNEPRKAARMQNKRQSHSTSRFRLHRAQPPRGCARDALPIVESFGAAKNLGRHGSHLHRLAERAGRRRLALTDDEILDAVEAGLLAQGTARP